jgi:tRNA (guanine-N7-)-methyltransferase
LRPNRLSEHSAFIADRRDTLRRALGALIEPGTRFVWEVGSGHGHFLTAYAQAHPSESCIGIDIESDRIARANRKRDRAGLGNLLFVRADAGDFLASMPEGARFTAIFILFPDPWPKRRHHKNRIVKPEFLSEAAARSEPGARLFFRTDHEPYFREVRAAVGEHGDWAATDAVSWPLDAPTVFQRRAASYFTLVAALRKGNVAR